MPGYYGQPSSVEQAMFRMKTPYDMMNMQNEAGLMNTMAGQNWYTPDPVYGPSPFDSFLGPLLGAGAQLGAGYLQGYGFGKAGG